MNEVAHFPLIASLLAGIATFVSPCVLPLIPAYITFITGASLDDLKSGRASIRRTFFSALFFVLGFSAVFVLLGASATYAGGFISAQRNSIRLIGGAVIILFGIHVSGLYKFSFLYQEKRMAMKQFNLGYLGSFLVGIAFAIGWTPCVGPILSSILILASTQETLNKGVMLLAVYSLGLGIPFLITALFINKTLQFFTAIKKYFKIIEIVSGSVLIAIGLLILTNSFTVITIFFNRVFS